MFVDQMKSRMKTRIDLMDYINPDDKTDVKSDVSQVNSAPNTPNEALGLLNK